jgi:N-acetyl-gamma-glutamyl-phosphate reductase
MKTFKLQVGIAGAAGYTGGELLRLLVNHPRVDIVYAHSKSQAGKPVTDIHEDLIGETGLVFTGDLHFNVDFLFLCLGHGESRKFIEENTIPDSVKIIDLSQDFRYQNDSGKREFIYGLPELYKEEIRKADSIANPGCFATAIQLALLPVAEEGKLRNGVHVSGITGSTGAGHSMTETNHFSWRNNNVTPYKILSHQHVTEIERSLELVGGRKSNLFFVPYRGNFTRGILITAYMKWEHSLEEAIQLYKAYYKDDPFVAISKDGVHLKQVVNTNKSVMYLEKQGDQLIVVCAIDNLLKGASGQAVQNMNLMAGLPETTGLLLKAAVF